MSSLDGPFGPGLLLGRELSKAGQIPPVGLSWLGRVGEVAVRCKTG